ncbi:MAG: PAS domain-containing protein [Sedimentisphaerales bacterium]|nr:PAS domain-containing protein [Sedimentisphaerales bacterium]
MTVAQPNQRADWYQVDRLIDHLPETVYAAAFADPIRFDFLCGNFEELTGYAKADLLTGRLRWMNLVFEKDRPMVQEAYQQCRKTGEDLKVEYRITAKDGGERDILDRARPVFDEKSQVIGLEGMFTDITFRRKAERQLERTQMLQSMGRLAAGIVHEINTPVQFIGDNIHFLSDSFRQLMTLMVQYRDIVDRAEKSGLSDIDREALQTARQETDLDFLSQEIPSAIEQTMEGVKRVTSIVSAMRDFSHIDERRMAPADINKALNSTLIVVHNALKYVAHIETDFDKNLPLVLCCIDDLNQVFVNLLINASHAIGDKINRSAGEMGTIAVGTCKEGENVIIRISDTGTGIPEEVQKRMYEPFFTTKGGDKGTGQGLLFVRTIVCDKHKGKLDCQTEVGKGTTFIITLPIQGKEPRRK